jgi:hypothetical protein
VAFNSVLQIILYAPFALFYINVVRPHDADWDYASISYSVVAQSVAIFLGTLSNPKTNRRHPTRSSNHNPRNPPKHPRPRSLQTQLHQIHCPPLPPRPPLHNNNPLRLTRSQRSKPNHPGSSRLRPTNNVLCHHIPVDPICMPTNGVRI